MKDSKYLVSSGRNPAVRLIAFYLPQFHPIPENDDWWGKGFTEWTNVTKAAPLFEGHYQPHLPTEFGFYDLRVRQTRRDQIKVAKEHGIDGFCYHYYWFSGKRLLHAPLDDMLADPESDMPFCLCWPNENWTRRWDASEDQVLISQRFLPSDDIEFIKSLEPFLVDKRYIRVGGRPLLIVYRPQQLPDAARSASVWRDHCRSVGLGEIHLCAALTHGNLDYAQFGFDSGIEFPPHQSWGSVSRINGLLNFHEQFTGYALQYAELAQFFLDRRYGDESQVIKTVVPSWDNTARTGSRAFFALNATPDNYEFWLSSTIDQVQASPGTDKLVFINAWNEWAEGCHLEPDRRFGRDFLVATLNAKNGLRRFATFPDTTLDSSSVGFGHWSVINGLLANFERFKAYVNQRPLVRGLLMPAIVALRIIRKLK